MKRGFNLENDAACTASRREPVALCPGGRIARLPRPVSRAMDSIDTRGEIARLANEAREAGGWVQRLRIARQTNAERIRVVNEAVALYFERKRSEIALALSLDSDNRRKRLLAASMEESNVIEREVTRLIGDVQTELQREAMDDQVAASEEEVRRIAELDRMRAEGRITERRYAAALAQVEALIDERVARRHELMVRMQDNLDRRLAETLQELQVPPRL